MLPTFIILLAAVAAAASEQVFLPKPSGKHFVGKTQHVFNHTTLDDPTAPIGSNNTGAFIVLARLIEEGWEIPPGELQNLWTHIQWQPPFLPGSVGKNQYPTLLFSPGAGMPCSSSTVTTSDLASQGYTVLCIDHPGEPPYLKIPESYGGGGVYGIPINDEWANDTVLFKVNRDRKSDFDALLELYPPLVEELRAPFNSSTYIHFGFSMGGSVGTDVVSRHDSVIAGINEGGAFIDTLFGETVNVKKPFLIFRDGQTTYDDSIYGKVLGLLKGIRLLDFSDVGLWYDLLDWNTTLVGTIGKPRMRDIQTSFTTAFFDMVLGKEESLLDKPLPSVEWPEVKSTNL